MSEEVSNPVSVQEGESTMAKKKPSRASQIPVVDDAPKKGKECPACGAMVGMRTKKCLCGHTFVAAAGRKKNASVSIEEGLRARHAELEVLLASQDNWLEEKTKIEELLEVLSKQD